MCNSREPPGGFMVEMQAGDVWSHAAAAPLLPSVFEEEVCEVNIRLAGGAPAAD